MGTLAMVDIELKSDHGDWDCVFVDEAVAACPEALARFVRRWGEEHAAHSVWFRVTGARSAATLDMTLHGAQPVTVAT